MWCAECALRWRTLRECGRLCCLHQVWVQHWHMEVSHIEVSAKQWVFLLLCTCHEQPGAARQMSWFYSRGVVYPPSPLACKEKVWNDCSWQVWYQNGREPSVQSVFKVASCFVLAYNMVHVFLVCVGLWVYAVCMDLHCGITAHVCPCPWLCS